MTIQTASEKTISDLFRQHEVKADSVGDFLDRFYKPERYKGRGEEYAERLLASYQEEIKNRGFTFIPKHDSVTGYCVSYYEVRNESKSYTLKNKNYANFKKLINKLKKGK